MCKQCFMRAAGLLADRLGRRPSDRPDPNGRETQPERDRRGEVTAGLIDAVVAYDAAPSVDDPACDRFADQLNALSVAEAFDMALFLAYARHAMAKLEVHLAMHVNLLALAPGCGEQRARAVAGAMERMAAVHEALAADLARDRHFATEAVRDEAAERTGLSRAELDRALAAIGSIQPFATPEPPVAPAAKGPVS